MPSGGSSGIQLMLFKYSFVGKAKIFDQVLLGVVCFYQVFGTLGEWALKGSFYDAVQDFRIGLPGIAAQVIGGYLFINYLIRK